jgi:hypothetical protein
MRFPPEIRAMVFKAYLAKYYGELFIEGKQYGRLGSLPVLARTSRAIRAEFLPVFYAEIKLVISWSIKVITYYRVKIKGHTVALLYLPQMPVRTLQKTRRRTGAPIAQICMF